jgi:flagellar basal body-associated protein FliL
MKVASYRLVILTLMVALHASMVAPLAAMPTPSKTTSDQSLAERQSELAKIQAVIAQPEVTAVLTQQGVTNAEVHQRLAQLSPEEIHALSTQLDQLQAAGSSVPKYIWILIAVLLGLLILGAIF